MIRKKLIKLIRKSLRKSLRKSHRRGMASPSMAQRGTTPNADVDLDLVWSQFLFSHDFSSWFGRATFESIVAEVIQKEHLGHKSVTFLDTLELVATFYAPDAVRGDNGGTSSKQTYSDFYRQISNTRNESNDTQWDDFYQTLMCCVRDSCNKLRNEKVLELPCMPIRESLQQSAAPNPAINDSENPPLSSSPITPHDQPSVSNLATPSEVPQDQQEFQQPEIPATTPEAAIVMHRYTSFLKEHADVHGGPVEYQKKCLSSSPIQWECTAIFGDFSGQGVGRSFQQAKHAASKQVCQMLGLSVQ